MGTIQPASQSYFGWYWDSGSKVFPCQARECAQRPVLRTRQLARESLRRPDLSAEENRFFLLSELGLQGAPDPGKLLSFKKPHPGRDDPATRADNDTLRRGL